MMIRLTATAFAATLALAAPAFAGEGNGDPFPVPDVGMTHTVTTPKYTMGGAAPYNYYQTGTTTSTRGMTADGAPFGMPGRTIRVSPVRPAVPAAPGSSRPG